MEKIPKKSKEICPSENVGTMDVTLGNHLHHHGSWKAWDTSSVPKILVECRKLVTSKSTSKKHLRESASHWRFCYSFYSYNFVKSPLNVLSK